MRKLEGFKLIFVEAFAICFSSALAAFGFLLWNWFHHKPIFYGGVWLLISVLAGILFQLIIRKYQQDR